MTMKMEVAAPLRVHRFICDSDNYQTQRRKFFSKNKEVYRGAIKRRDVKCSEVLYNFTFPLQGTARAHEESCDTFFERLCRNMAGVPLTSSFEQYWSRGWRERRGEETKEEEGRKGDEKIEMYDRVN